MKNLKEYLAECKKTWNFRIKVAGDLPEKFESGLKNTLSKWDPSISSAGKTPVQKLPLDFPQLENVEVHMFDITANYPVTPNEVVNAVREGFSISPECFVVRVAGEPTEVYQEPAPEGYIVKLTSPLENPTGDESQKEVGEKRILNLFKELTNYKGEKLKTDSDKPFKSDSTKAPLGNHELPDMRKNKK